MKAPGIVFQWNELYYLSYVDFVYYYFCMDDEVADISNLPADNSKNEQRWSMMGDDRTRKDFLSLSQTLAEIINLFYM